MKPFYNEAQVAVAGENLTLVCDFSAIDCIESVTGENWDDIVPQLANPPRSLVTKILWGFLRRKHEGVTLDEAAGVAFGPDQQAVGLALADLIMRACNFGEEPKEAKDENPRARRGRSQGSGKSG